VTAVQGTVAPVREEAASDHRGSWLPTGPMISSRLLELRKRRGVMITILVVVVGLPSIFLGIRLLLHAINPTAYGPAGGADIFTQLVAGPMNVFGFIVAALLGCTAGSSDLSDGMFRHLVVTGRSRVALYFARIPAGLAIIGSAVALGFTIICLVCVFAAPSQVSYNGASLPPGLTYTEFVAWAGAHPTKAVCDFNGFENVTVLCSNGPDGKSFIGPGGPGGPNNPTVSTPAQVKAAAIAIASHFNNYESYRAIFLEPPLTLMVGAGLWLELIAIVGFVVGLGLSSLLGQRTVSVIILIVLEIVLTPIIAQVRIPYMLNVQRALVGIATDHLEPNGLVRVFQSGGGGGPGSRAGLLPEETFVAVLVVIAWLVGWTALGAWRMRNRDA
jgi:ABC-type transport system involved in multi-copper enzyme maturation permease subunit